MDDFELVDNTPDDPIKQVIVMRTDLNMRKGKMIAQGAHASVAFLAHHLRKRKSYNDLSKVQQKWIAGAFTKITVQVGSEEELMEIASKAEALNLTVHVVTDAGKTEFNGVPTRTCLCIGPHRASWIDQITGHLKLL